MAKSYLDKDGLLYFLQKIRPSQTPSMDGTASTGTSKRFAAEDHVHPTDTSLAPKASPAFTGTPTAPTAATGTTTTQLATTEFVANAVAASTSGVSDVRIDGTSVVTSGVANIPIASSSANGAMSSSDKSKLDGITYTGVSDVTIGGTSIVSSGSASITNAKLGQTQGTCSTATATFAKTVSASGFVLVANGLLAVRFSNEVTSLTTLNVNSTGAKYVVYRGTAATSSAPVVPNIPDGATALFMYTGTYYTLLDWQYGLASSSYRGYMSIADKNKLDSITITNGIIDASNLPSFVDDVIEAYPRSGQTELSQNWLSETSGGSALTPETGKIYILMADSTSYATNTQFRWSGTAYVKMLDGGVTSITNAEIDTIVAA
jgi:hypothetical protein